MRCSSCGFENREGVRFCEECGGKLEQVCPACGAAVPPGRKFCGCGQALGTSGTRAAVTSPPEGATSRFSAPVSYTPRHLAEKILTSRAAIVWLTFARYHVFDKASGASLGRYDLP